MISRALERKLSKGFLSVACTGAVSFAASCLFGPARATEWRDVWIYDVTIVSASIAALVYAASLTPERARGGRAIALGMFVWSMRDICWEVLGER